MKKNHVFKTVIRQIAMIRQGHLSFIYFFWFIDTIFGGFLPVLSVFFTKIIMDVILKNQGQQELIWKVLVLSGVGLLCIILKLFVKAFLNPAYLHLRQIEFNRCAKFYQEVDYEKIEDSEFQDELQTGFMALSSDEPGFQAVYHNLGEILVNLFSIILFSIILCQFSIWIAVVCLCSTIVTALINQGIAKYINKRKKDQAHTERQKDYFNSACSNFENGKDIRVFNLKDSLMNKYKQKSLNYVQVIKDIANRRFLYALIELVTLILQDGISYYLIVKAYFDGMIDLSDVSLYISSIVAFSTVLRSFISSFTELISNAKYTEAYFNLIDYKSEYINTGDKKAVPLNQAPTIEFKNVWFKYPGTEKWILQDFNFKIEAGQKIAIVGTNGAGKSTIVKLVSGLFRPTRGEILVNGVNSLDYEKEEYYSMLSTVFQDYEIYACSILTNVIGNDVGEEAITKGKECLKRVGLQEKIEELPLQYDTQLLKVLDENGVDLSGGQKQKIAIARALYKSGNIVILDEPTSALDALAEAEIYQSFNDLVKNKTAIYISHRLSSTKFCDKIAFLDETGLREYGTHEELMRLHAGYYEMFKTQGKYYQEEATVNE